jgi:apolipoprotein N-acyltransferase
LTAPLNYPLSRNSGEGWGGGKALAISIALLAGYTQACSIAAPWDGQAVWWLQILSLAVLVWQLNRAASPKRAAVFGWCFALAWLCGTFWWLYISMHTYGGLAAPLAVLAIVALAGFLSLYYAAACWAFRALACENTAFAAIIFAASWMLAELARNSWFTGFPWGAGGYAHVDGPLSVYSSHVGVYGVGFVASLLAAIAGLSAAGQRLPVRVYGVALLVCVWGLVAPLLQAGDEIDSRGRTPVALLQGNIPQGEKFDGTKGVPEALAWYAEQLQRSTATLVIAPETAVPLLPHQLPEGYWAALEQRFGAGQQAAIIGIPLGNFEQGYTNSVLGLKPGAAKPYQYDKHHLVPFGEFIPPLFRWFTNLMNIPLGDFNRGTVGQASFEFASQRWAPNICYEDLFGDELAARFIDPAKAPTVMVNISNIGWFGNSVAIDQHLNISRMRTLEFARPMIRATNTGATVIINHRGEVTHSLERHTRGVLVGEVEGRSGTTPFAWWAARFGLWPLWLLGAAIISIAAYARKSPARA